MASIQRSLSGRTPERKVLSRLTHSGKSEFVAIYGRRRIGKTFLVRRFYQDQQVQYFEMAGRFDGTVDDHLQIFAESMSACFYAGAQLAAPKDWHEAFRILGSAIATRKQVHQKVVLFFDELPWIATHRSGCLEELEHFWNAWCSRRDDIILIVCGSAASWMLRRIIDSRGGLHNRLTQTIRLLPLSLAETREYFEDRRISLHASDLIELYMVFGGVPHYLDQVENGRSVAQVVDAVCLGKDGALAQEFDRLFVSLFGADPSYTAVVRALSRKRRGLTRAELLKSAGLASGGGVSTILENLEQAGFVTSTVPFGRQKRDCFFRLTDEFSLFHLKWMAKDRPKSWQHVRKTPRWQAWSGLAFEDVCLRHSAAIERALGIWGIQTRVSAWLHKDAQIDMLIDRADNFVSLIEIKFADGPFTVSRKVAEQLQNKIAVFREQTKLKKGIQLVMLTSYGVTQNQFANAVVDAEVTMADLFAA